jgi:hypothetical protein
VQRARAFTLGESRHGGEDGKDHDENCRQAGHRTLRKMFEANVDNPDGPTLTKVKPGSRNRFILQLSNQQ